MRERGERRRERGERERERERENWRRMLMLLLLLPVVAVIVVVVAVAVTTAVVVGYGRTSISLFVHSVHVCRNLSSHLKEMSIVEHYLFFNSRMHIYQSSIYSAVFWSARRVFVFDSVELCRPQDSAGYFTLVGGVGAERGIKNQT